MNMTNISRLKLSDYIENSFHKCGSVSAISTSVPIFTPPLGKRFVITDIVLSTQNDNTVRITEDGNGTCANIFQMIAKTQANTSFNFSHSFRTPYFSRKVDNDILITTTTTALTYYSITGYIID